MRLGCGEPLGSIFAFGEGTWELAWDGTHLWATHCTNENRFDDRFYRVQIRELLR